MLIVCINVLIGYIVYILYLNLIKVYIFDFIFDVMFVKVNVVVEWFLIGYE